MSVLRRKHGSRIAASRRLVSNQPRQGFTLLEIILSLAILAGSLAALGEVLRLAAMNGQMAQDETQAQILAASVMDELLSGARAIETVNSLPFDLISEPPWTYSIALEQTDHQELILARIRVEQQLPDEKQPPHFELIRWLPNPDYIPATAGEDTSTSGTSSTSTTSGQSSGSSGSSGGQTSGAGQR